MRTKQGKIRAFALTALSVILVLGATHSTATAQSGDSYYAIIAIAILKSLLDATFWIFSQSCFP